MTAKRNWDTEAGLGRQKIFEVRKIHNDLTFIDTFLTLDFCRQHKLFSFGYNPGTDYYEIESREFPKIKQRLLFSLTNRGQPMISVRDGNYKNRGELYLEHDFNGVDLQTGLRPRHAGEPAPAVDPPGAYRDHAGRRQNGTFVRWFGAYDRTGQGAGLVHDRSGVHDTHSTNPAHARAGFALPSPQSSLYRSKPDNDSLRTGRARFACVAAFTEFVLESDRLAPAPSSSCARSPKPSPRG